jgi:hypothetical protein
MPRMPIIGRRHKSDAAALQEAFQAHSERVASLHRYSVAHSRHERATNELRALLDQCNALFAMAAEPSLPVSLYEID